MRRRDATKTKCDPGITPNMLPYLDSSCYRANRRRANHLSEVNFGCATPVPRHQNPVEKDRFRMTRLSPHMARRRLSAPTAAMILLVAALANPVPEQAHAQRAAPAPLAPAAVPSSYADVADHAVQAATIVHARVRRVRVVEDARAANVPPHLVRLYIEAETRAVLFGQDPLAARFAYVADLPRQADGRPPRIRGTEVLLFARRITNSAQVTLVTPGAQLGWTVGREDVARQIARELGTGAPPPAITGVAQAFHVAGTVAGESETQIFLRTENGQPVSLTILRRPGQAPRWAVAFGEIVDESARVPARRTLPWYRLACGLPPAVPATATRGSSADERAAITRDYALVLAGVGACDRTPPAPVPVPLPAR